MLMAGYENKLALHSAQRNSGSAKLWGNAANATRKGYMNFVWCVNKKSTEYVNLRRPVNEHNSDKDYTHTSASAQVASIWHIKPWSGSDDKAGAL